MLLFHRGWTRRHGGEKVIADEELFFSLKTSHKAQRELTGKVSEVFLDLSDGFERVQVKVPVGGHLNWISLRNM